MERGGTCDLIDVYDPERDWGPDHSIICASRRRAGKSVLAQHLLARVHHQWDAGILLFSNTHDGWPGIAPNRRMAFSDAAIGLVIKRQEALLQRNMKLPRAERRPENLLVILDDVVDSKEMSSSPNLTALFVRGRHLKIGVLYLTQHFTARGTTMQRRNCD